MALRYTKLIQVCEMPSGKQNSNELIFPFSKSNTVTKLKKLWPMPSEFFYDLYKKGVAIYTDPNDGSQATISVIEFDPTKKTKEVENDNKSDSNETSENSEQKID